VVDGEDGVKLLDTIENRVEVGHVGAGETEVNELCGSEDIRVALKGCHLACRNKE